MAHVKVLTPSELPQTLTELLGPLPSDEDLLSFPTIPDPTTLITGTLISRLEEGIRAAKSDITLVLPPGLFDTISDNVVQVAKDEPCGLRGSVLRVSLVEESENQETLLVEIKADYSTPTTHILDVVLRPDTVSWYTKMANIFRSLSKRRVVISPKYELKKKSLYHFNS